MSINHLLSHQGQLVYYLCVQIYLKVITIQYFEASVEDFLVHLSLVNVELYGFAVFDRCFEAYLKFLCALHCPSCRSPEHSCFDLDLL